MFKFLDKISTPVMNKVGEIRSPYLRPLEDLKNPKDCPFKRTEYQLLDNSLHIISIINSANPNFLNTLVRQIHVTLS